MGSRCATIKGVREWAEWKLVAVTDEALASMRRSAPCLPDDRPQHPTKAEWRDHLGGNSGEHVAPDGMTVVLDLLPFASLPDETPLALTKTVFVEE